VKKQDKLKKTRKKKPEVLKKEVGAGGGKKRRQKGTRYFVAKRGGKTFSSKGKGSGVFRKWHTTKLTKSKETKKGAKNTRVGNGPGWGVP